MPTERIFAGAQEWANYQRRLGRAFIPAFVRGIQSGGLRCIPILHQFTETAPPASPQGSVGAVFNRDYLRRWRTRPLRDGVVVFNDSPYAGVIEKGRRAGSRMPPPNTLRPWARRKLGLSDADAKSLAFVIARAIGQRGLKARRVMERALPKMRQAILDEVKRELREAIQKS